MGQTVTQETGGPASGILCARQFAGVGVGFRRKKSRARRRALRCAGGAFEGWGATTWLPGGSGGSSGQRGGSAEGCAGRVPGALPGRIGVKALAEKGLAYHLRKRTERLGLSTNTVISSFTGGWVGTGWPASAKGAGGSLEGSNGLKTIEILSLSNPTPIEPNRQIADPLWFKKKKCANLQVLEGVLGESAVRGFVPFYI